MTRNSLREKELKNPIGVIPKEWGVVRLEDVTQINAGQTAPQGKDYFENGKFPFVRVKHLNNLYRGGHVADFDLINEKAISENKLKLYPKGSIIFPKSGESIRLERRAILDRDSYVVNHLCVLIPDKEKIDDKFLFYYLTHIKISELLTQTTTPSINLSQIKEIKVSRPSLPEQRKIASILSTVDEAIQKTEEIIQKTQKLKRSLMQQLLTKGIGHKKFKRTEIGEIPEEWDIETLGETATLQRGFDLPVQSMKDGDYPVMASNGIIGFHSEFKVKGPGVTVGRSGAVGEVHYIEHDFWPHNTALFVKDFHENNPKFVYYFLQKLRLQRFSAYTGVPTLNRNFIHPIKVAVPKLNEQHKIASILSGVDEKIEKEKQRKEQLEKLKKGLMQDLLTGKKRVRPNCTRGT